MTTMSRARMTRPVDVSRIVPVTTTVPADDSMTMRTRPWAARSAEVSPVRTRTVPVSASYVTVPLPVSEMVALPSVVVHCGPSPVVAVVVPGVWPVDVAGVVPVPAASDPVVASGPVASAVVPVPVPSAESVGSPAAVPSEDPVVASPSVGSGTVPTRLVGRGLVGGSGLGLGRGLLRRLLGGGLVGRRRRLLLVGQGRCGPDAALLARREGLVHEAAVGVVQPERRGRSRGGRR